MNVFENIKIKICVGTKYFQEWINAFLVKENQFLRVRKLPAFFFLEAIV